MRLLDTFVLIASLDPNHPYYQKAVRYLQSVRSSADVFVPCIALHECNHVLKKRLSDSERERVFQNLSLIIPKDKVVAANAFTHSKAITMAISGMSQGGLIDTMIAVLANEHNAQVISVDSSFRNMGIRTIW